MTPAANHRYFTTSNAEGLLGYALNYGTAMGSGYSLGHTYSLGSASPNPVQNDAPAYSGPLVQSFGPAAAPANNYEISGGMRLQLNGERLQSVTNVLVGGVELTIISSSDRLLTLEVPLDIPQGIYDLALLGAHGRLTVQGAVSVLTPLSEPEFKGWTKKLNAAEVKVYVKSVVGAGKVQVFVNGKEIAWINAKDDSDSKLRFVNGSNYLVRTVTLQPGKNRIEVKLDGKRVRFTTYALN